jgi:uncharacterized membrane protein
MENIPHRKTINTLYLMLIISTVLGFVPSVTAFLGSVALWFAVLIAAYACRAKDKEDGLLYNHMTYMIGTVWIGTSFILIASLAGGYWIWTQGDSTAFDALTASLDAGAIPNEDMIMNTMTQYMLANKNLIMKASLVTVVPAILYFVYRIGNGFSRACKGYRIANPKSWL